MKDLNCHTNDQRMFHLDRAAPEFIPPVYPERSEGPRPGPVCGGRICSGQSSDRLLFSLIHPFEHDTSHLPSRSAGRIRSTARLAPLQRWKPRTFSPGERAFSPAELKFARMWASALVLCVPPHCPDLVADCPPLQDHRERRLLLFVGARYNLSRLLSGWCPLLRFS